MYVGCFFDKIYYDDRKAFDFDQRRNKSMKNDIMMKNHMILNETEKGIWDYIIHHIETISKISSRELSRAKYTHPTTVLRFVKKLGYENYNDFKVNVAIQLKTMEQEDYRIAKDEELLLIQNKMSELNINIINQMRTVLNTEEMNRVYALLEKYSYIDFVATELNAIISQYASHLFFTEGKICQVYQEWTKQLLFAKNVKKDHLVFLISKTGKNQQIIETARELRKKGVTTVAVTTASNNLLAKNCDYLLMGLFKEGISELGQITFTISSMYIFNILFAMLFSHAYTDVFNLNDNYLKKFYEDDHS